MNKQIIRKIAIILFGIMVFLNCLCLHGVNALAEDNSDLLYTARPSVNGRLHVEGTNLVDEKGDPVQLRGISTHGLTWYPDFIDEKLFKQLSNTWNSSFIRLAMYSDVYCKEKNGESLKLMRKGINAAIANDMYVLVDWHILSDNNPNINKEQAIDFFDKISSEFSDAPNLIYEICNEPNGDTTWDDIVNYCNDVIPVIRKNVPDAVIIVGTPEYDRRLVPVTKRPLNFENVMYCLHFYAATHKDDLNDELRIALNAGIPVFVSECGICEHTGDGTIDFASSRKWFNFLLENNISYSVWSFSNKDESSAFFKHDFDPVKGLNDDYLSDSGKWVKELIKGVRPDNIPAPADTITKGLMSKISSFVANSLGDRGYKAIRRYPYFALVCVVIIVFALVFRDIFLQVNKNKNKTYYYLLNKEELKEISKKSGLAYAIAFFCIILCSYLTLVYMCWRIFFSVPVESGVIAIVGNIVLLAVEIFGFGESIVFYESLLGMKNPPLPKISDSEYPHVDIFIATYNEPCELLRKTINGCNHLKYPDKKKVHVYVCDDNRRPEMRALAEEMGVGYFDRPDNKGAKAGNLNNALKQTSSPYIVTLDADMIVKSDFLLKTIPYFVEVENRCINLEESKKMHLGLLQTPQCFYDPDVFQHALYSERRVPNEQDFFYRTIEVAKSSTNSVVYGGSNTVLSRRALEDIGGFYTESITEDFATGLLIEAKGYISLALPEPLASGQTPHTYKEHIQQRTRWGRGVIVTAKKLKYWRQKGLSLRQKISYWSCVAYWYSPIKNLIYVLAPLLFATFAVPVLKCNWLELLVYWIPMFVMQEVTLRVLSGNAMSMDWSGIYETSVMPHLFIPILKESFGISLSKFKVTDKSARAKKRTTDYKAMIPFIILIVLSVVGIIRVLAIMDMMKIIGLLVLLFWMIRNLYFLLMSLFLIDGRDSDNEVVHVIDAEPVEITIAHGQGKGNVYEGVTTRMTEHSVSVFLDDEVQLSAGAAVRIKINTGDYVADMKGAVTVVSESKTGGIFNHTIEILDYCDSLYEYLEVLYDRIPSLPQTLSRDTSFLSHLWQNIAHRVSRTTKF
ncbi:cellulase family glycosylhydrolase [Butyrivibrio sp. JL13D10]|uniref:cellulase family glycosylhydrolase n=1 Tax=Butyrivibrio sp. JL13D10 TaxID=3236815 RepID=UPI0038B4C40A